MFAMISMLSLEVAMVYQFGNNDTQLKQIMTSYMGFFICLINSLMVIFMIIKAKIDRKDKLYGGFIPLYFVVDLDWFMV